MKTLLRLLAGIALLSQGSSAWAQFMTNVALNKETYLTFEAVEATVTISNRSGADIVMGGANNQAWLTFTVTAPDGSSVPAMHTRSDETIVFKAGSTISRKVLVSDTHPFSEYGNYMISATVYHPPSQQYYASNRARATFTDATPFWEQSYGVPLGLPGAGQIRRYTLSQLRDTERTYLYVRVLDDKTKLKLATYSLGTCIFIAHPQVTVDNHNMLHVLFMAAPHIYSHVIIDTQGQLVRRRYHQEIKTDRPQLGVGADGEISVSGGQPYDPAAANEAQKPKGRSIREKPPGL
ncbi:MAG: hypothetical protein ACOYMN_11090 [Roseimicrobium sp.]